jgi:hypothetical protein
MKLINVGYQWDRLITDVPPVLPVPLFSFSRTADAFFSNDMPPEVGDESNAVVEVDRSRGGDLAAK